MSLNFLFQFTLFFEFCPSQIRPSSELLFVQLLSSVWFDSHLFSIGYLFTTQNIEIGHNLAGKISTTSQCFVWLKKMKGPKLQWTPNYGHFGVGCLVEILCKIEGKL